VYFEISYLSNTEEVSYILTFNPEYSEIMISCAYIARELNISPSTVSRPSSRGRNLPESGETRRRISFFISISISLEKMQMAEVRKIPKVT